MATKIYKRYDSIKAFVDYLQAGITQPFFQNCEESFAGSEKFCKTKDFKDANDRLLYGDKTMAKVIKRRAGDVINLDVRKYQNRRTYSPAVVGAVPHVPNYIAGCPCSMIRQSIKRVKSPVVTIGYNTAVSGYYSAVDIFDATVAMVAAFRICEAKGIRVGFHVCDYDTSDKDVVSYTIKIKAPGEPLDLLKMAYPMAHPSMNRRHKFRFQEVTPGVPKGFTWSYGRPETDEKKMLKHFSEHGINFDRVFCYESIKGKTPEQIAEMICAEHE